MSGHDSGWKAGGHSSLRKLSLHEPPTGATCEIKFVHKEFPLMKVIATATIQPNTGWTARVEKGQRIRVSGVNIVDFVVFNDDNLRERLDASRTRGNQG